MRQEKGTAAGRPTGELANREKLANTYRNFIPEYKNRLNSTLLCIPYCTLNSEDF